MSGDFMRRAAPAAFAFAAVALAVSAARAEDTTLAIPGQNVLFLSRYIADDQHLWSKEGLNVKILDIIGIGSMNAVIAGSADFSMGSGPTITRAWAKGQKVNALLTAISQSGQSIVIRKDVAEAAHFDPSAPITERGKVLKGRTIAIGGVGAIPDVVLKVIAKDAGVAPGDVIAPPMQPPEFMAAFATKKIDGFSNSPPFVEQVVSDGTGVLVSDFEQRRAQGILAGLGGAVADARRFLRRPQNHLREDGAWHLRSDADHSPRSANFARGDEGAFRHVQRQGPASGL